QMHPRVKRMAPHRREAASTIPEEDRRAPVPGGRCEDRVPGRLPVIMGVHISPPGGDQKPVGLDHPPRRRGLAADRGDPLAIDCYVTGERRAAGSVDDGAAANDDVVHGWLPPL